MRSVGAQMTIMVGTLLDEEIKEFANEGEALCKGGIRACVDGECGEE